MKNFLMGMTAGIVAGGSIILVVHPMSKIEIKKACKRAGKFMQKVNCSLHGNQC